MNRAATKGAYAVGFAAVLAIAAWVRLNVYARVLIDGLVRPADADCDYHLRRITLATQTWPRISAFDELLGWPSGAHHHWALGFDWLGAAWVKVAGGGDVALAAALFPVVLGLLAVWLSVDIAQHLLPVESKAASLLAGLTTAVVPQFVGASRLARVDHHVAEALSMALFVALGLRRTKATGAGFEVCVALAVLFALATFGGAQLYVAIFMLVLVLLAALEPTPRFIGSGSAALLAGAVLASGLGVLSARETGHWLSFVFPSLLQPALVAVAGLLLAATVVVCGRVSDLRARLQRLGVMAIVAGLVVLVLPGVGAEVRRALSGWLAARDPWLGSISEFQPLFGLGKGPLETVLFYFGGLGLLAAPLLAWFAWEKRDRVALAVVVPFAALLLLTLVQVRFGRVLAPLFGPAVVAGLWATKRWLGETSRRDLVATGLFLTVFAIDPETRRELQVAPGRPASAVEQAVAALSLAKGPEQGKAQGVLAPWDLGSTLLAEANRPVIASGFGSFVDPDGFALSERALTGNEAQLLEVMTSRDLGLVVTGAAVDAKRVVSGHRLFGTDRSGKPSVDLNYLRARPNSVLSLGGSGAAEAQVPHAEHFLPIFASSSFTQGLNWALPVLWAYERVEGAHVEGAAPPNSVVSATLRGSLSGAPFDWHAWTMADAQGHFSLRLCVPTNFRASGLSTGSSWQFSPDVRVEVPEAAVRGGATISL